MKKLITAILVFITVLALAAPAAAQGSVNSNNAAGTPADPAPGVSGTAADGTTYAVGDETVHAPGTEADDADNGMRTVLIVAAVIAGAVLLAVIIYLAVKKYAGND